MRGFEQADAIRELGVGINTLPSRNSPDRAAPGLDTVGIRTHELFYMNRNGQEIWREPRGTDAGFEYPQFSIHRGRLQAVIHDAVRDRIGETKIHTGHRLASLRADDGGLMRISPVVTAHRSTVRGDVLIGADGIHSIVRETLYPNEGPARWNGSMLWRGAIDPAEIPDRNSMVIAGGMGGKLVIYPIGNGAREDRLLTNWAVLVKIGDGGAPPRKEDWSRMGKFEDLMPHVQCFNIPFVDGRR